MYTCYPQSMTKTAKAVDSPRPVVAEPEDVDAIALHRVSFRHQDDNLQTKGLSVGDRITDGRYNNASVSAMYATPVGVIVELTYRDGRGVTLLHTGDTDAVVA